MQWLNPPPQWQAENGKLTVTTAPGSDFWRMTHYGFTRDSGHFYYQEVSGDFVVEARILGRYEALYDQAGLMVRLDEKHWIKCGIEYVQGIQHVSAVVTREYSDWSVLPLKENPAAIWLRLTRQGSAVEIQYSLDGADYSLLRLAYLPESGLAQAGLMCASPDGPGFQVTFEDYKISQAG